MQCHKRDETLLISARKACSILGIGKSVFYSMSQDGRLGPVPILGGRYDRQEIIDWVRQGRCCPRSEWLRIRGENGK